MSNRTSELSIEATRLPTGPVTRISALVLRLAVAYLWIENLDWKVPPDFGQGDRAGLWAFTNGSIAHPVFSPYSSFVESFILPTFVPFGWLVYVAEIALGVFLLLGLATRFWAVVGFVQSFVIYLTVGAQPHEWPWTYVLMMLAHLAVFALAAGRVAGVDGWLRRRAAGGADARLTRLLLPLT
ncbi:MAG: DoxX family membrane protein [Austwickia sp.]|nr:DoxX family membrane protein [Austwickia sp.]